MAGEHCRRIGTPSISRPPQAASNTPYPAISAALRSMKSILCGTKAVQAEFSASSRHSGPPFIGGAAVHGRAKGVHDRSVELRTGTPDEFGKSFLPFACGPVWTIRGKG